MHGERRKLEAGGYVQGIVIICNHAAVGMHGVFHGHPQGKCSTNKEEL